jgi:hypothetical protein
VAELGRVRIKAPATVRPGEVARVRAQVFHPMEIVERRGGKPVDRNYRFVHRVVVSYRDREILQVETTQSVSENPLFTFALRPTESGTLRVSFLDTHGGRFEATADIKVA